MTAEAAMVLPLFLFFVLNILFIIEMLRFESRLTAALQQAGDQVREYAYYTRYAAPETAGSGDGQGTDADGGLSEGASFALTESFVRGRVAQLLGAAYLKNSPLKGSISYLGSSVLTDGGRVEIHAHCRLRPFIPVIAYRGFTLEAVYMGHAWTGYRPGSFRTESTGSGDGDTVYVARTGIVYHTDPLCPYLHPDLHWVPAESLSGLRADDGSIYHPCESCRPGPEGTVLVAPAGNRYHSDPHCTAIYKEYHEESREEAQGHLRPCPRCGHGQEQGGDR